MNLTLPEVHPKLKDFHHALMNTNPSSFYVESTNLICDMVGGDFSILDKDLDGINYCTFTFNVVRTIEAPTHMLSAKGMRIVMDAKSRTPVSKQYRYINLRSTNPNSTFDCPDSEDEHFQKSLLVDILPFENIQYFREYVNAFAVDELEQVLKNRGFGGDFSILRYSYLSFSLNERFPEHIMLEIENELIPMAYKKLGITQEFK